MWLIRLTFVGSAATAGGAFSGSRIYRRETPKKKLEFSLYKTRNIYRIYRMDVSYKNDYLM